MGRNRAGLSVSKHAAGTMRVPLRQQPDRVAGDQLPRRHHEFAPLSHNLRYVTVTLLADGVATQSCCPPVASVRLAWIIVFTAPTLRTRSCTAASPE